MKPHKHCELIKLWADGALIEARVLDGWVEIENPNWSDKFKYRVKPAEKVVRWLWVNKCIYNGRWYQSTTYMTQEEAEDSFRDTFITQYKKLKWSREEFDE
jgi:hypothetical protein